MAVLRRRQALPALRRNLSHERAVQTRMMLAAERALEATLPRVLAAAGRRAAQAARHGHDAVDAVTSLEAELGRVLTPAVAATARQFGARVIQAPKGVGLGLETKAFADLDAAIRRHTGDTTARRVVQISDSLREVIRRTVERAVADNLGEEATAEAIVEATAGEIAMARARRIARTEIHNAAMYGQQAAAEASPLQFEKVWLATEDSRTREAHAKANGQRVGLNEHFVLEDEDGRTYHLAYPGDARAPAGQVINCRCVCLYEPVIGGAPASDRTPIEVVDHPDRPVDVVIDEPPPVEDPIVEDVPLERDIEARPYERGELVLWASGDELNTLPDGTPRVGSTVRLIGPNDLYLSPDAPEVDRSIARLGAGILARPSTWLRRPVLWRVTVPAGPRLPEGLFSPGGAGATVNSGVGRFRPVTLTINQVRKTTWGEAAPKGRIDPEALPDGMRRLLEASLADLIAPDDAGAIAVVLADQLDRERVAAPAAAVPYGLITELRTGDWDEASLLVRLNAVLDDPLISGRTRNAVIRSIDRINREPAEIDANERGRVLGIALSGERNDEGELLVPESLVRTLRDTRWSRRSLRVYLERLLDGDIQDEPGVGEPATDARVLVVEATMNIADALGDRTEE